MTGSGVNRTRPGLRCRLIVCPTSVCRRAEWVKKLVSRGLLGSQPGVGAHFKFRELRLGDGFTPPDQSSEESAQKAYWDADDPGILQREYWGVMYQSRGSSAHYAGPDDDQEQRSKQPGAESPARARGVEALPKDGEHDHRHVCRSGDSKGQRDKEGDVE